MKLNQNCVRDVLLDIEDRSHWDQSPILLSQPDGLETFKSFEEYGHDVFVYTLIKLLEAKLIIGQAGPGNNTIVNFSVGGLTWEGHKFLDTVRDPVVWSRTKKIASHLESVSVTLLSTIGTGVINHMIDKAFDQQINS